MIKEQTNRFIAWWVAKNFFSVRAFMLYVAVYMTLHATFWAERFAETTSRSGTEIGIITAAIFVPLSAFTTFVYHSYSKSRSPTSQPGANP